MIYLHYNHLHYKQGKMAADSHKILADTFGDQALSRIQVYAWYDDFKQGRDSLENALRSGRFPDAVTPENVAAVEKLIREDRIVTYAQIQQAVGIESVSVE